MDLVHKIAAVRARPLSHWVALANHYVPPASTVLLTVAIAWYLAQIVWLAVPTRAEFDWSLKSPVSGSMGAARAASGAQVDFNKIAEAHLFGIAGAEPVIETTIDAPETTLNLKLRGTVAADEPEMAHAIIADGGGKDEVYFIKDTVPGGATLHEVQADRVILNRGGALEALKLPKLSETLGRQTASRTASRPAGVQQNSMQAAMNDSGASSFTDILRPQPFMPNGELKGYRIYPGRDRRKFASLGFRPGDLVTEVNGQGMTDLQSGMEVFKEIGSASQLTVTIERAGQPMVITVDSSQLSESSGANQ